MDLLDGLLELFHFFKENTFYNMVLVLLFFSIFLLGVILGTVGAIGRRVYPMTWWWQSLLFVGTVTAGVYGLLFLAFGTASLVGPAPLSLHVYETADAFVGMSNCTQAQCILRDGHPQILAPSHSVHGFVFEFQLLPPDDPLTNTKTAQLTFTLSTSFGQIVVSIYPGHTISVRGDGMERVDKPWSTTTNTYNTKGQRHETHRLALWFGQYDSKKCANGPRCVCLQVYADNDFVATVPVSERHDGKAEHAVSSVLLSASGSIDGYHPVFDLQRYDALKKQHFPPEVKIVHIVGLMGSVIAVGALIYGLVVKMCTLASTRHAHVQ